MVSIRRTVTYKIFINKQLIYANVTIRLALFIYINIPVHRLSSNCAKLASDVGIAVLAILSHEDAYVDPLSSEDVAVVVERRNFLTSRSNVPWIPNTVVHKAV